MSKSIRLVAALLGTALFAGALSGCASVSDGEAAKVEEPDSVLVNYRVSGGIAGVDEQLTVYRSGKCELVRNQAEQEFTLDAADVVRLEELLQEADFFSLEEEYLPPQGGADQFTYVITYQAKDRKHMVTTMDGAIPPALEPVIVELDRVISENS